MSDTQSLLKKQLTDSELKELSWAWGIMYRTYSEQPLLTEGYALDVVLERMLYLEQYIADLEKRLAALEGDGK